MSLSAKRYLFARRPFNFATNLKAYWKLATNASDSSGNAHSGTATGVTFSGGYAKFGSGYIGFSDHDDYSFTDGVSDVPAHILIPFIWNDKTGIQYWISKREDPSNREWQVLSNGTDLFFTCLSPTTSLNFFLQLTIPVSSITAGVLNTLQFVDLGTEVDTGHKAYLNGNTPIGTASTGGTYTGMSNTGSILRIGDNQTGTGKWKADSKEIAVWKNRIMTGAEIQELHDRVIAGTPLI